MKVSTKTQKLKMGDAKVIIVQGVNCPKARWTYRGICMLASVCGFIIIALELFWPELCSSSSAPKQKDGPPGTLVHLSAPFWIYYTLVVVRSFYLPVPTPFDSRGDLRLLSSCFLPIMAISMCNVSIRHDVQGTIFAFSYISGTFAAVLLERPVKDVRVQHVVYNYFVLALIGYLGYQRPFWPACLFIVALVVFNAFLFYGVLRLDLPEPPEPERRKRRTTRILPSGV